jgi:hypothetical protein
MEERGVAQRAALQPRVGSKQRVESKEARLA